MKIKSCRPSQLSNDIQRFAKGITETILQQLSVISEELSTLSVRLFRLWVALLRFNRKLGLSSKCKMRGSCQADQGHFSAHQIPLSRQLLRRLSSTLDENDADDFRRLIIEVALEEAGGVYSEGVLAMMTVINGMNVPTGH